MNRAEPDHHVRRRAIAAAVATLVVGLTAAGLLRAQQHAAAAEADVGAAGEIGVVVAAAADVETVWTTSYSEYLGLVAAGTTQELIGELDESMQARSAGGSPCLVDFAEQVAEARAIDDMERQATVLRQATAQVIDRCAATTSDRRLTEAIDALPAFGNAMDAWLVVLDARALAGVDPTADSALVDRAWATANPRLGIPVDVDGLDALYALDLPANAVHVTDGLAAESGADPLGTEVAWLLGPDGWTAEADHPSFDELAGSRDAISATLERRIAATVANVAASSRSDANVAGLWIVAGLAALVVGAIALALTLVSLGRALAHRYRTLRAQAERDELTGLANRTSMRNRVGPWLTDANGTVGLAVVDIDHFKQLNDELGHAAGDELLATTAHRLVEHVVEATSAVCRWGGDEFVVALRLDRHDTEQHLDAIIGRLHAAITAPVLVDSRLIAIGASIGGAACQCGTCDLDDLFRAADRFLYDAKSRGRNTHATGSCLSAFDRTDASH